MLLETHNHTSYQPCASLMSAATYALSMAFAYCTVVLRCCQPTLGTTASPARPGTVQPSSFLTWLHWSLL